MYMYMYVYNIYVYVYLYIYMYMYVYNIYVYVYIYVYGLYRYDGLGILKNLSGPDIERKRKLILKVFKNCGLNITIKTNSTSVDFLDVRFNLKDNTYEPYRKPNSDPIYINKQSNHPPNIIRDIPKAISKRLSDISGKKSVKK